ncbi:MAG: YitT family protein [Oscillospiraceae bacterium]|nr:YitT family protein [Oscillospiraceae bacterium]MBR2482039.1 YitT family protein [Oscillospiraceae bacterium]
MIKNSKHPVMRILWDYTIITVACALYSFGFNCFYQSNNLSVGGFTGIAQILNYFIPALPIGTTTLVMNIPILILAWKKQGPKLLIGTVYAISATSLMIDGLNYMFGLFPPMDPLLAGIYGGVSVGIAVALLMIKGATTGGTELLARLLKYVMPNLSIGNLCLMVDTVVVLAYALVFRSIDNALYGIISMYIFSIAMDTVVYGSNNAKVAYIISEHNEEITRNLLSMDLGITLLHGEGAYTGASKKVALCAFKRNQFIAIKAAVNEIDPKAFIIVCEAHEVLGEGFLQYSEDNL